MIGAPRMAAVADALAQAEYLSNLLRVEAYVSALRSELISLCRPLPIIIGRKKAE